MVGAASLLPCRGCLGPLDRRARAGLCGTCWSGLRPLPPDTCPRCQLTHGEGADCPDPVAWERGFALWDYHGGRPAMGALLVPGIKAGEGGWRRALLHRLGEESLDLLGEAGLTLITSVPPSPLHRLLRGFDLAEEAARLVASRMDLPCPRLLERSFWSRRQALATASRRRRLPSRSFRVRPGVQVPGQRILLVDDVWTTGTTLLRCARALQAAGAAEVRVLALFRARTG